MRTVKIAVAILSCVLLTSCSSGEHPVSGIDVVSKSQDPIVGIWKGTLENIDAAVPPGPNGAAVRESMRHPTLNLREDHTFELRVGYPNTGTWSQTGQEILLTMKSIAGVNVDPATAPGVASSPPVVLTVSADNKSISMTGDRTITFTK